MTDDTQEVYIASADDAIKIGVSIDPEVRVRDLSVGNPTDIELLHRIPMDEMEYSARDLEQAMHQLLRDEGFGRSGEWFDMEAYYFVAGWMMGSVGTLDSNVHAPGELRADD